MNALIEKIQTSLLNLIGSGIEVLPGIIAGLVILLLTRLGANLIERVTTKVGKRTLRSQSLQLLLAKTSYVAAWVVGILAASVSSPASEIDLVSFGDSSIDFVVRDWTLPPQKQVRQVKTKAIIAIKKAFDQAHINIPYPIRTLYFYNQQQFNDDSPALRENKSS